MLRCAPLCFSVLLCVSLCDSVRFCAILCYSVRLCATLCLPDRAYWCSRTHQFCGTRSVSCHLPFVRVSTTRSFVLA